MVISFDPNETYPYDVESHGFKIWLDMMQERMVRLERAFGWADYADSVAQDFATGQVLGAGVWHTIDCDGIGHAGNPSRLDYEPPDRPLMETVSDGDVITGREGEVIGITTEWTSQKEAGTGAHDVTIAYDIRGAVNRLYERTISTEAGMSGTPHTITTMVYTLDTWELNGGLFVMNPQVDVRIWNVRHIIARIAPQELMLRR